MTKYLKIEVFIPKENLVELANSLNEKDILRDGNYDYVFATTNVTGSFRPLEGANPHIGKIGEVSQVEEVKLEFRINRDDLDEFKRTIELIHPYEEPVVNIIELLE